jgi:hypothetical protein
LRSLQEIQPDFEEEAKAYAGLGAKERRSLPSRLTLYVDVFIGDHCCGFRRNRSVTDQIFYIRQILEKKWEHNGTVHQLFIGYKKDHVSVRTQVLYNSLTEFDVPTKLVRLIKMSLNERILGK